MDEPLISTPVVAAWAFALAFVFGFVGSKSQFCTLGAVSDVLNMGDWTRMRLWGLAVAVAMAGTAFLQWQGAIDTANSIYTGPDLIWLSNVLGGLVFGVGMTLASGCGSKTLIRIGGGNLKSLVVFAFLALSAYATMRGLFAVWRTRFIDPVAMPLEAGTQALPGWMAHAFSWTPTTALWLVTLVFVVGLLWFSVGQREFRHSGLVLAGVLIGGGVVGGWYLTGVVAYVPEHPHTLEAAFIGTQTGRMESLTFIAPMAYTMELFLFWSDSSRYVSFGIATVLGVIAGSAADNLASGRFRIESFYNTADLVRHIIGGILMGFGGVTAMGCTIGQGLSGLSTLAIGAFLATAAMMAGAAITMKIQYWHMMRSEGG
jgi:uncharacterized protein